MRSGSVPHIAIAALALAASGSIAQAPATAPTAMTKGLPIAEGVWVDARRQCGAADQVWVYSGYRFGVGTSNQYVGSKYEQIQHLSRSKDGFIRIGDGPWEVKAVPGGKAIVRTYSTAEGEVDRTNLRQCDVAALPKALQAPARQGLAGPAGYAVYVPGTGSGTWSISGQGAEKFAVYTGNGLIRKLGLACVGKGAVGAMIELSQTAPVTTTRLGMVYQDGGTMGTVTAAYYVPGSKVWMAPFGEGEPDILDTESRITIDMGPAGAEMIPLAGSRAAIRGALAPCWKSRR